MQTGEYEIMRAVEDHHWWYTVLRRLALTALAVRRGSRTCMLDAGCGTGGMMARVRQEHPDWTLHGIDLEQEAVAHCQARGLLHSKQGSVDNLPFDDASLLSLDVLYHAAADPDLAVAEMARVLRPGGLLVVNLPAFNALRGAHDTAVCGVRRYTVCQVRDLLEGHRMKIQMIHYWNAWLFLPLLIFRRWSRLNGGGRKSDLSVLPGVLNKGLAVMGWMEARLCRVARIPFGTSVFAVAARTDNRAP